ncbi:Coiled-coil domain-containing protein 24 [Desmophyllum pertusum]|uniref:Coiled-coil domain-containing protein 24 n=1 Tax=Desmophyllum pertusum TaxID=174260 RepID=A0A9W9ZPY9_9CNID|nr:Coiled-coil domain-containing protein 24 [Desmophyllum pertusum]
MSERSLSSMEWRLESFESRASLWRLIEEFVPESERLEIKEALGEDLVDETLDLQNETSTLLEIWQDYREETDKEEKEQALQRHLNRLPEPPMIRENLKKEVKMFVEMLHQRAREEGRNTASVLSQEESSIVEYVFDNTAARPSSSSSRPSTAHSSRDGRQTPMRATPSSDGSRCTSSLSDHLDSMNDKLNALEIDRITDHLRQLLLEEKEGLLGDIAFLQDCLMEESDYREHVTSPLDLEPSLRDLRDLGTKLEKELLHNVTPVTKQPKRRLSESKRQTSLEEKPSLPTRRISFGSESHPVPRPPSTSHDRHHHSMVPSRTLTSKNSEASGLSRGSSLRLRPHLPMKVH